MQLFVKTYLSTIMPNGKRETWLQNGNATNYPQGSGGYQSVDAMRKELRRRFSSSETIEDIPNGVKLTPKPGFHKSYAWQEVTLES